MDREDGWIGWMDGWMDGQRYESHLTPQVDMSSVYQTNCCNYGNKFIFLLLIMVFQLFIFAEHHFYFSKTYTTDP